MALTLESTLYCSAKLPAFAAQVVAAYHPTLRGTPFVVIRQEAESRKTVVYSCSALARRLGVDEGMPLHIVRRRLPEVAVVPRKIDLEESACGEIAAVLDRYSPVGAVKANGTFELDLSRTPASRSLSPEAIGRHLRRDIAGSLPITELALGFASTAGVAAIMARTALPDGIRICPPGREQETVAGLEVSMLPGISSHCRAKLAEYGIVLIGQLQRLSTEAIVSRFGSEGEKLCCLAKGLAVAASPAKEEGCRAETVLDHDLNDDELLVQKVRYTADKFCFALKNSGLFLRTFTMVLKYSDNKKVQRTVDLHRLTNDFPAIAGHAQQAFAALATRRVAIRSILLTARNLRSDDTQLDLFTTTSEEKQAALARQIVKIRNRNSFDTLVSGGMMRKAANG